MVRTIMKNSRGFLWILATFSAAASIAATVLAGCSDTTLLAYVKTNSIPVFSLTSPTASYYDSAPLFSYSITSGGVISVTLNGAPVDITNDQSLIGSVTGLNTLTVDVKDWKGNDIGSTIKVEYFLNDLGLVDGDAFGGFPFYNWTDGSMLGATPECYNSTLAVRGASSVVAWGWLYKPYPYAAETKSLQACQVVSIVKENGYVLQGLFGGYGDSLTAVLSFGGTAFGLSLEETSGTHLPPPYYVIIGSSTGPTTLSQPATLWFYRNGDAYQAAVMDASGAILGKIVVPHYTSANGYSVLVHRGITLCPFDSTSSWDILVQVDNYAYYK
jgi:hypothetical protein